MPNAAKHSSLSPSDHSHLVPSILAGYLWIFLSLICVLAVYVTQEFNHE